MGSSKIEGTDAVKLLRALRHGLLEDARGWADLGLPPSEWADGVLADSSVRGLYEKCGASDTLAREIRAIVAIAYGE